MTGVFILVGVLLVISGAFIALGFKRYGLTAYHTNDFLPGFTMLGFAVGIFFGFILGVIYSV